MLDPDTATHALRSWCQRRGVKQGVDEFVSYLRDKDASYLLPVIRKELKQAVEEDAARNSLTAETGQKLSDKQKQSLQSAFGAENSDFNESVSKDKIAGVDATFASRQVRGSVASQLLQLQENLTS